MLHDRYVSNLFSSPIPATKPKHPAKKLVVGFQPIPTPFASFSR
jgi:hypothetical protein